MSWLTSTDLLVLLASPPAFAHGGALAMLPGTDLRVTLQLSGPSEISPPSIPLAALVQNVEIGVSPGRIEWGLFPSVRGLVISMSDVSLDVPGFAHVTLTDWQLDLESPSSAPPGGPIAADGSFLLADHELRVREGLLHVERSGLEPLDLSFADSPLSLSGASGLVGLAIGDSNHPGSSWFGFDLLFDHTGTLALGGGSSLELRAQGRWQAEGTLTAIPEAATGMQLTLGLAVLLLWRSARCFGRS